MRSMLIVAALVAASPAFADNESAYTDFDLTNAKRCVNLTPAPVEGETNDGVAYECKGYGSNVVSFVEGDLRSFVSFGAESGDHCSRRQTFSGFNSVGKKIEWRLKDGKAFATIFRWSVSYDPEDSNKQKSWLVVTKIDAHDSCHVGYVEGGYPQANEKARWLADTAAEAFVCAKGIPVFFANPGTETDGVASPGCGE